MVDYAARAEAEDNLTVPYDTADPKQVNDARKKDSRLRRERLNVVASLMELKQGRAWMHDMLEIAHLWAPSFMPGDPYGTAFKEGERNIGLRLLADVMAAAPQQYVTMCEEANGRV